MAVKNCGEENCVNPCDYSCSPHSSSETAGGTVGSSEVCCEAKQTAINQHDTHASPASSGTLPLESAMAKEELLVKTVSSQVRYVITAVIGILCAVSIYQCYCDRSASTPTAKLLESLENHGYSGDHHLQVKKHGYGSPDLLTEDLKQKLNNQWSQKASSETDTSPKEEAGMKEDGTEATTNGLKEAQPWEDLKHQYVVVFDAGSTGTRLHVFKFQRKNGRMELKSELFNTSKPGLSEYLKQPEIGAASLQPMIDEAMEKVPPSLHSSTSLIFKATGGFRLLNASAANGLLTKMKERLSSTDFRFSPDDIAVMPAIEEGIFGWITVNYLLGKLDGESVTAAALDLGGASMQVTYQPQTEAGFTGGLHELELMGTKYSLYTHSYLGLGLLAARNSTLIDQGDGTLTSDCLPVMHSDQFTYHGKIYHVRGPDAPCRDGCWEQVGEFLTSRRVWQPWELVGSGHQQDIYLFSYLYDILVQAGVIGDETERILTVRDFYLAAYEACRAQNTTRPFLCQDLTYISRLLGEGFMLWDMPLRIVSEINSGDVSWSLGAALNEVSRMTAG